MAKRQAEQENVEELMLKDMWKVVGPTAMGLDTAITQLEGIPLERCLPLQYMLGVDALPLRRIYSVVGAWSSTKSAFCDELCARFQRFGSRCLYMDNEKKKNPYQTLAQFRWFLDWTGKTDAKVAGVSAKIPTTYTLVRPDSLDVMLKTLVAYLKLLDEYYSKGGVVQRAHLIIVDSLFSLNNQEAVNDIKDGEDPNNIANLRNANQMKTHIQVINTLVSKLPVAVVMVNELAERQESGIDIGGRKQPGPSKFRTREVGGRFKDFAYSGNFMMEGLDASEKNDGYILGKSREVPHVRLNLKKACFGVQRDEPIIVPYRTLHQASEGEYQDDTLLWYDWDASLTHLLHRVIGPQALAQFFDLKCTSGNLYESRALGLYGLSATEFGAAIHASPEVMAFMQKEVFHIQRIRKFTETPDTSVSLPLGRKSDGTWAENELKASLPAGPGTPETMETV